MATETDQSVFTAPWNGSDIVLIVEDKELHVHKWILVTHSPVFKAMLEGHFKEANQDKITLKEKDIKKMVQFLKMLYPSSMFGEARAPLNDESRLAIMTLAEEYQCVNLIKLCIDEAKITSTNVLQILPYAVKYHQAILPEMFKITNWSASTTQFEEILPNLEGKEISSSHKMLLSKCRYLESTVATMHDEIISLMCSFLTQKRKTDDANKSLRKIKEDHKNGTCSGNINIPTPSLWNDWEDTLPDSRCVHAVNIREIKKTNNCINCKKKYKEKFIAPIPSCEKKQAFFNMLQVGNHIKEIVKKQEQ